MLRTVFNNDKKLSLRAKLVKIYTASSLLWSFANVVPAFTLKLR